MPAMTSSDMTTQQNGKLHNMLSRLWSIGHTCFELLTDLLLQIVLKCCHGGMFKNGLTKENPSSGGGSTAKTKTDLASASSDFEKKK